MKNNLLIDGNIEYELDAPYIEGARACHLGVAWRQCPYPKDSHKHKQWDDGHFNESIKIHQTLNCDDVINTPQ